jgi:hypothetical protein
LGFDFLIVSTTSRARYSESAFEQTACERWRLNGD